MCLIKFLDFGRKYGLDDNTMDFIGHALALHRDDRFLNEPALDTVKRMKVKPALDSLHPFLEFELLYVEYLPHLFLSQSSCS